MKIKQPRRIMDRYILPSDRAIRYCISWAVGDTLKNVMCCTRGAPGDARTADGLWWGGRQRQRGTSLPPHFFFHRFYMIFTEAFGRGRVAEGGRKEEEGRVQLLPREGGRGDNTVGDHLQH